MTTNIIKILGLLLFINSIYIGQELKLDLSLDKDKYITGEAILISLKIINISSTDIKIDNLNRNQERGTLGLYPILVGTKQHINIYDVMTRSHFNLSEYNLPAGDTAYYFINLTKRYSNFTRSLVMKWLGEAYIEPDIYNLKYELLNMNKKKYISNTVKFSIVPPSKKEKKIFLEYKNSRYNGDKLRTMLVKYPNSVYNTQILRSFLYHTSLKGNNLSKALDDFFIADTSNRFLECYLLYPSFRISNAERERISEDPKFKPILKDLGVYNTYQRKKNYLRKRKKYGEKEIVDRKRKEELKQKSRNNNEK